MASTKVVHILGWYRSGTTLLGGLLQTLKGVFFAGELVYLPREVAERRTCTCGRQVGSCDVWSDVLRRAFGSTGVRGDLEDLGALTPRVLRVRRLPRLLRGHGSRWPPLRQYVELAGKVYRSTSAVTSSGTIIDSSKSIPAAMLLPAIRNVDPVVIHMVRDPRAVAFSRTRRKLTLGPGARPIEMDRDELWQTVLRWSAYNSAVELLRMRFHGSWMRVRYEDLCADPSGVLRALANFLEAPPVRERLLDKGSVDFGETHAMAGNPIIFRRESSSITEDDEWVSAMKEGQKALVTAGTFPLLARYGYPVWRRATVA